MLRIRIVRTGAIVTACLAVTVAGAAAQTASPASPGAPLPLLQIVHQKSKPMPRTHVAKAEKRVPERHRAAKHATAEARHGRLRKAKFQEHPSHHAIADARHQAMPAVPDESTAAVTTPTPAATATAALPPGIWPGANSALPGDMTPGTAPAGPAALAPQPASGSVTTEAVVDTDPNEIVGNDQKVQTAVPAAPPHAVKIAASEPPPAAKPPQAAASAPSAAPTPVVHAMVARPTASSPVGSASWIAHVLAALGGALTAGVVAWFLIRPAPERTYG